jgi:hypothetical protein
MRINPFKKKRIVLSASQKIDAARGKIEEAFFMFTTASKGIDEANSMLVESIEQHEEEKRRLNESLDVKKRHIENAKNEMMANNALKDKLAEFIPSK